jgi:hypothetical protein
MTAFSHAAAPVFAHRYTCIRATTALDLKAHWVPGMMCNCAYIGAGLNVSSATLADVTPDHRHVQVVEGGSLPCNHLRVAYGSVACTQKKVGNLCGKSGIDSRDNTTNHAGRTPIPIL